jgi:predicted DNA-binding protein (UPF0251 family)
VPRPCKRRLCRRLTGDRIFKPRSIPMSDLDVVRLELGELEAMRLCDVEGLDQAAAGLRMGVSRGTVQRLLSRGRSKLVTALLRSSALVIEKGEHDEDLHSHHG